MRLERPRMLRATSQPPTHQNVTGTADSALLDALLPEYDYVSSVSMVIPMPPKARGAARTEKARGALGRAPWRSAATVGIKLVHSAIFLLNSAAILHIFVAGVIGHPS